MSPQTPVPCVHCGTEFRHQRDCPDAFGGLQVGDQVRITGGIWTTQEAYDRYLSKGEVFVVALDREDFKGPTVIVEYRNYHDLERNSGPREACLCSRPGPLWTRHIQAFYPHQLQKVDA